MRPLLRLLIVVVAVVAIPWLVVQSLHETPAERATESPLVQMIDNGANAPSAPTAPSTVATPPRVERAAPTPDHAPRADDPAITLRGRVLVGVAAPTTPWRVTAEPRKPPVHPLPEPARRTSPPDEDDADDTDDERDDDDDDTDLRTTVTFDGAPDTADFALALEEGAWRLVAEAAWLRSPARDVWIDPDDPPLAIELRLEAVAAVVGSLRAPEGTEVAGIEVVLEPLAGAGSTPTTAGPDGTFRFDGVAAGPHRLVVGPERRPLAPRREVEITAPFTELPPVDLPPLARVRVRVLDAAGTPVAGARVRGSAVEGGAIDAITDPSGTVLAERVVPGPFRARVEHPKLGRTTGVLVVDDPTKVAELEVRYRR